MPRNLDFLSESLNLQRQESRKVCSHSHHTSLSLSFRCSFACSPIFEAFLVLSRNESTLNCDKSYRTAVGVYVSDSAHLDAGPEELAMPAALFSRTVDQGMHKLDELLNDLDTASRVGGAQLTSAALPH